MAKNEIAAIEKPFHEGRVLPPKPQITIRLPFASIRRYKIALNQLVETMGDEPPYKIEVSIPYNGEIEDGEYTLIDTI